MRITDIIAAKRDGRELVAEDIARIVLDYARGNLPDYQMSAFLMASFIRGLNFAEISAMTQAMVESGSVLDLSAIEGTKVDKHSTGGVGDKTTLIMVPMLAACGLKVPKMSGRGLGFTGGTLDKLESISGFNTSLASDRFVRQVNDIGAAIAGQTQDIVPADKKIYALRDVTATVESIPLIAASVMSKKIACSSDVILLDVKVGTGAFVPDLPRARELARTMIAIGTNLGRRVGAAITDMNQPLGCAVGNALEVVEAIDTLKGGGPADLRRLCVELSAMMLFIAERTLSVDDARKRALSVLDSGQALEKFHEIVAAQDGNPAVVDDESLLSRAKYRQEVVSLETGFVSEIDCALIGAAASMLGAGRQRKEDAVDPAVGIVVRKKLGDHVEKGESLAVLHVNDKTNLTEVVSTVLGSYRIGDVPIVPPLIHEVTY
ncbi:MAG: thymidine phosphorylase [Armatimonadota bacterium]